MFFEVVFLIFIVILFGSFLSQFSLLKFSLFSLLDSSSGNISIKAITIFSDSNIFFVKLISPILCIILIILIPSFARWEENVFRRGYSNWSDILKQSVKFGLVHCLVGVPIFAGLAIILSGIFLGYKYKIFFDKNEDLKYYERQEKSIRNSTIYHSVYNTTCVTLLFIILITDILK